ncbi:uncharacterized protein LOC106169958 [Lingula anatina]|uniref:Uncharacterized protein LOC106169958 n=1 Tax=Lingula anatina TaxID=7574 RepID=A0A1S3J3V3_LINAN|nr:uncharacterized protein LOC106169958 [Lingula anatina]|eukprot:XP_013405092.1 uncharacterized protein LOC106169958 [Lingula anatina]
MDPTPPGIPTMVTSVGTIPTESGLSVPRYTDLGPQTLTHQTPAIAIASGSASTFQHNDATATQTVSQGHTTFHNWGYTGPPTQTGQFTTPTPSHVTGEQATGHPTNTGWPLGPTGQTQQGRHNIPYSPLDQHVSRTLRQKIWDNEYVSLRDLLPHTSNTLTPFDIVEDEQFVQRKKTDAEGNLTLILAPVTKKRSPLTFTQWQVAFNIFSAIYIQKFPQQSLNLLQYNNRIVEMYANKGSLWLSYDERFRANFKSMGYKWEVPDAVLLAEITFIQKAQEQPFRQSKTCFRWNKGIFCDAKACHYGHRCSICNASHPANACPKQQAAQGHSGTNNHRATQRFQPYKRPLQFNRRR